MRSDTFRKIALALPDAEERETWGEATFRVRSTIFAMMASDGKRGSIKATEEEQAALLTSDPQTFYSPSTSACTDGSAWRSARPTRKRSASCSPRHGG